MTSGRSSSRRGSRRSVAAWLEYGDTLRTGRDRERLMINAAAGIGRLLRFDTNVR